MEKRERVHEIDIAKGIGIILVVLGHSIPDANTGIVNVYMNWIYNWIYSFHMPLFLAMAGLLYWEQVKKIKCGQDVIVTIKKRFVRLMIPYFFYSFLLFGAKIVLASWSRRPVGWHTLMDILFGNSPCGNAWFLWALFILSCVALVLSKTLNPELLIVIFGIGYFFQNSLEIFSKLGISIILKMGIWFFIGVFWGKNSHKLKKIHMLGHWKIFGYLVIMLLAQIIGLWLQSKTAGIYRLVFSMMLAFVGIMLIWLLSILLSRVETGHIRKSIEYLGRESMAIYLLSYFVQTPGVTIYAKTEGLGLPYFIWVIGLMAGAILFAILAYELFIKKSKILSKLMIGA